MERRHERRHSAGTRHPFLTGKPKRLLIDGKWVEAASGKTFDTRNPSTGAVLASVAEGDAEDIDRAVAAARRASNGPWRKTKPFERQNLLLRLANPVEQHFEELATLDTLDMGAPISRMRANRLRALGMLRFYAGQATAIHGETVENSLPGDYVSFTLKEPVGAIIPWNGPLTATVWRETIRQRSKAAPVTAPPGRRAGRPGSARIAPGWPGPSRT